MDTKTLSQMMDDFTRAVSAAKAIQHDVDQIISHPTNVQPDVLPDGPPRALRVESVAAMTDIDLNEIVMALHAAGGQIAGAVSGKVHHAQPIDWPLVLTLAEVVRINAAILALTAEREIEQRAIQASLGLS